MGVGLGNSMGPAYHKGVPLLGVPENPIDNHPILVGWQPEIR